MDHTWRPRSFSAASQWSMWPMTRPPRCGRAKSQRHAAGPMRFAALSRSLGPSDAIVELFPVHRNRRIVPGARIPPPATGRQTRLDRKPGGRTCVTLAVAGDRVRESRYLRRMITADGQGRPRPPMAADELETLVGFLEFQRATFAWKCQGLDAAQLQARVAASSMTLGGMIKHLARAEDSWFAWFLRGLEPIPPWDEVDWDGDWNKPDHREPEQLRRLWHDTVDRSRVLLGDALAEGGPDQMARRSDEDGTPSLRWILCHLIEEYARHNGHADLIREAIDGQTG